MSANMLLLSANPKKRRASKKRRSPAQRDATARMLAANAGKKRTRRARPAARVTRRSRRSRSVSVSRSGIVDLLKSGAIGGAGAVANDVLFGYAAKVLPDSMQSKVDATGGINLAHYAAKGALALGVGVFGAKVLPRAVAVKLAEGALTVSAYEIMKSALPASLTTVSRVGYMNPARVLRGAGKIVPLNRPQNMSAVVNVPVNTQAPLFNNGRIR